MAVKKKDTGKKVIADNRRARFDYHLDEVMEAGIMLTGTEVKSLRTGQASIAESYVAVAGNELELINANIPIYEAANRENHAPKRPRRLLMHRREIDKVLTAVSRQGRAVVPLKMYFNARGIVKLEISIATGKKLHDKRTTSKDRDWKRDQGRLMRDRG
ncbi:MAG: SsrA-binding protein [Robiginitomaculum sp.]|nr:MAG: SsrA-binding protein [Robiginitomaculum sp.]